ncbi:hypothetical protein F5Y05DRAFT_7988 [Hypoxylon sp. FL0543]|nr:hypothetical protein F5Y05DRAFT_7988 [Hypoxylon sp. FL0543]
MLGRCSGRNLVGYLVLSTPFWDVQAFNGMLFLSVPELPTPVLRCAKATGIPLFLLITMIISVYSISHYQLYRPQTATLPFPFVDLPLTVASLQ